MIVLIGLLAVWNLILSAELWKIRTSDPQIQQDPQIQESRPVSVLTSDITNIVGKSDSKVTGINVLAEDGTTVVASGSGTVYNTTQDGAYIITNHHVIENGASIIVSFANGEYLPAEVIGVDIYTDLALLKVYPEFKVEAFTLGDSSLTKKGEWVMAIGHSMGAYVDGSVTVGVVSSKDRIITMDADQDGQDDWDMMFLQTDAAINPGNSGGPLINMNGELIGITTMKMQGDSVDGINFAIPINEVVTIVEQLKTSGKVNRPFAGFSGRDVSSLVNYQKSYLGISLDQTEGMLISKIAKDSPAEKAGIHMNDILIEFDGTAVDSYKTFRKLLYGKISGDTVDIVVLRDKQPLTLSVVLE